MVFFFRVEAIICTFIWPIYYFLSVLFVLILTLIRPLWCRTVCVCSLRLSLSSMPIPCRTLDATPSVWITKIVSGHVYSCWCSLYLINLVTTNQSVSLARIPYLSTQVPRVALKVTLMESITFMITYCSSCSGQHRAGGSWARNVNFPQFYNRYSLN